MQATPVAHHSPLKLFIAPYRMVSGFLNRREQAVQVRLTFVAHAVDEKHWMLNNHTLARLPTKPAGRYAPRVTSGSGDELIGAPNFLSGKHPFARPRL